MERMIWIGLPRDKHMPVGLRGQAARQGNNIQYRPAVVMAYAPGDFTSPITETFCVAYCSTVKVTSGWFR